ncbi:MAG: SPASM domain-containing protein [Thermodesulfovibrionales bacterium]|nr:SPASM domain-containing protein [Thermodesulfovibrionales bacterium]
MRWLNFFGSLRPKTRPFSAWQIELTTRCPLSCRMCIREEAGDWFSGDMRIDDFKKLTPYFKDVETVILEGWGESLLHKNIIEAIRLVKAEGAQAGFVTSGRVLTRDYISELITAGVDFVGFSLAGATPQTHNSIRVNSDLQSLIRHIQTFNEIKADKKTKNPKLHIIYLMLKDNISEAPALLQLAKDTGIEEVVLTNLIHVTNDWQESQRVFSGRGKGGGVNKDYEEILHEAEVKAKELKINLRQPSLSPVDVPVCEENPLRNLYISVDGEVSPCVYLYPPVPSPFKRIFCGDDYEIEKVSFGNIFREPFHAIWNKKEYIEFRERFILRKRRCEEMYSPFLDIERLKRFEVTPLPDPPEQCRTCHKILGV